MVDIESIGSVLCEDSKNKRQREFVIEIYEASI
jgi:hypothetical protein